MQYKNIIIFIDELTKINFNDFIFGTNQVLILEDNELNREKLKYLNSVNWSQIIDEYYNNKVYLAEYHFCDYTDYKSKFVSTFYFLDTEKIYRIKLFLLENKNKNIDIICSAELEKDLRKEFPSANYVIIKLEKYIEKRRIYYDNIELCPQILKMPLY